MADAAGTRQSVSSRTQMGAYFLQKCLLHDFTAGGREYIDLQLNAVRVTPHARGQGDTGRSRVLTGERTFCRRAILGVAARERIGSASSIRAFQVCPKGPANRAAAA
jgi:hypothetical protein